MYKPLQKWTRRAVLGLLLGSGGMLAGCDAFKPLINLTSRTGGTLRLTTASNPLVLTLAPNVEIELVRVGAGEFLMGTGPGGGDGQDGERPQHRVNLAEYYIGKFEVTVAQYRAFVQACRYTPPLCSLSDQDNYPVACMKWDDALAFCQWSSKVSGRVVRLPTEAEWEKAARGTDERLYPWGNEMPDRNLCNFNSIVKERTAVGMYSPRGDSPYGCADMAGNLKEWTSSLYKPYPYKPDDGRESLTDRGGRVLRGGGFFAGSWDVSTTSRAHDGQSSSAGDRGFRVCVASS